MVGRCVKLFVVLLFVALVAIGVSYVPFSLSDKFKSVVDKVSDRLKSMGLFGGTNELNYVLDFAKEDTYKCGNVNVVLDKVENDPKEGFVKFVHKGENNVLLNVQEFKFGETTLKGFETGLFNQGAGFFKLDFPDLLMVELVEHSNEPNTEGKTNEGNNDNGGEGGENDGHCELKKVYYFPGEDNTWVKLPEGEDYVAKMVGVFELLKAKATPEGDATPEPTTVNPPTNTTPSPKLVVEERVKEESDGEDGEGDDDDDDDESDDEDEEEEEEEDKKAKGRGKGKNKEEGGKGKAKKAVTKEVKPKTTKPEVGGGNLRNGSEGGNRGGESGEPELGRTNEGRSTGNPTGVNGGNDNNGASG